VLGQRRSNNPTTNVSTRVSRQGSDAKERKTKRKKGNNAADLSEDQKNVRTFIFGVVKLR
jgi:hypothetical protein